MLSPERREQIDYQAHSEVSEYFWSIIYYDDQRGCFVYCGVPGHEEPVDWDAELEGFLEQTREEREEFEDALANGQKPEPTWWEITKDPEANEFYRAAYLHYFQTFCENAKRYSA